ncbi:dipeptide ABC transporter ATP-binding protein [Bacillus sp. TS-2]|nr:dipeptide ABC transporter ATP-binding protein [Bacillus sp. TS-2]
MGNLLEVHSLQTVFQRDKKDLVTVRDVSFHVKKGETLAIVGESGSGKSVTSLSILGLLAKNGRVAKGDIHFDGQDLLKLSPKTKRLLRGKEISMIFQEPMSSLNPVYTIGNQLLEPIKLHLGLRGKKARDYAVLMLKKVGISRAETILDEYPSALSGGMLQRVMIAIALSCNPKLLIADEPTTALDVTIQAQILNLLKNLKQEYEAGIILITHDMNVVAEMADRVIVMYSGEVVESTDVYSLFDRPKHPYTKGLMECIPHLHSSSKTRLKSIKGNVPPIDKLPEGCSFSNRCPYAMEQCKIQPQLREYTTGHQVRCWLLDDQEYVQEGSLENG